MVSVPGSKSSLLLEMVRISFLRRRMSSAPPDRMPARSMDWDSKVRSAFSRTSTARPVKASSLGPPALRTSWRTVAMSPPSSYRPGRKTAPLISTLLAKRSTAPLTKTASPSARAKEGALSLDTVKTWRSSPIRRITRKSSRYASLVNPPAYSTRSLSVSRPESS